MSIDVTAYYLGAGASAQAIPTVDLMEERIRNLIGFLNSSFSCPNGVNSDEFTTDKKAFIDDLNILVNELEGHSTIDICLRRLYLSRDYKQYLKLKKIFTCYLAMEHLPYSYSMGNQLISNTGLDKRYDSFYANFFQRGKFTFPENFRIFTWNYDCQIIKAGFKYFQRDNNYQSIREALNVCANNSYNEPYPFKVLHLNGLAEMVKTDRTVTDNNVPIYTDFLSNEFNKQVWEIIDTYRRMQRKENNNYRPSISFSWESIDPFNEPTISLAVRECAAVKTLIVVGYSFPFFNRPIDRKLFDSMTNLTQVYFQGKDMNDSIRIMNKFREVINIKSEKSSNDRFFTTPVEGDTKEFYVPVDINFEF